MMPESKLQPNCPTAKIHKILFVIFFIIHPAEISLRVLRGLLAKRRRSAFQYIIFCRNCQCAATIFIVFCRNFTEKRLQKEKNVLKYLQVSSLIGVSPTFPELTPNFLFFRRYTKTQCNKHRNTNRKTAWACKRSPRFSFRCSTNLPSYRSRT